MFGTVAKLTTAILGLVRLREGNGTLLRGGPDRPTVQDYEQAFRDLFVPVDAHDPTQQRKRPDPKPPGNRN